MTTGGVVGSVPAVDVRTARGLTVGSSSSLVGSVDRFVRGANWRSSFTNGDGR